jgi:8-oxo-dGTP diphosphatase
MKDYTKRPGHRSPKGYDGSKYDKPSVACDVVVVAFREERLKVLLIERKHDPYQGYQAFPGGFVEMDESLEAAAAREVFEETGVKGLSLIPLGSYGDPDRDPRGRVISAAYLAPVRADKVKPKAGDDAREVGWFSVSRPPELAFDHQRILKDARRRLRELSVLTPRLFDLMPRTFARGGFLKLCQEVMGRRYDVDAFFEWLLRSPCFIPSGQAADGDILYRFSKKDYHVGDFMFLLL